ncbi:hypothetical protein BDV10DRAFT_190430 [Aspergillus recurvatus]
MLQYLLPFFPPVLLFGAVFLNTSRRFLAWLVVVSASLSGILVPSPYLNPLARYLTGFFCSWFIIWSANLLLIKDPITLQRIQKGPGSRGHIWQPLPPSHSLARARWAIDLALNFRAVGWNFANRQWQHPPITPTLQVGTHSRDIKASGSNHVGISQSLFLRRSCRRLFASSMWLAGYPCLVRDTTLPIPAEVRHFLRPVHEQKQGSLTGLLLLATTLYMFIDGIHALVSLVAVGLLRDEKWRYPPFFGPVKYLLSGRLQDLWGKFWHDLLKEGLLATSSGIIPWKQSQALWSVARIWACFVLTGLVHASASYAVTREPRPSLNAGVFYCLQPLGILAQMAIGGAMQTVLPKSAVSAIDLAVATLWLSSCFPWISGDPALRQVIGVIRHLSNKHTTPPGSEITNEANAAPGPNRNGSRNFPNPGRNATADGVNPRLVPEIVRDADASTT